MSTSYLPAYTFRKFCSGNKSDRTEFPKELRNYRFEKKKN